MKMENYNWGIRSRIWIVLACLFAVSSTFILLPEAYGATEEFLATSRTYGTDGRSYVEKDGNGNYVIHLYGSSYNMGYQHGKLLSEECDENAQNMLDFIAGQPGFDMDYLLTCWNDMDSAGYIPLKYKQELQGLVAGVKANLPDSPIDEDDLHATIVYFDDFFLTCSSFVVFGSATSNHLYHGRNLDYTMDMDVQKHPLVAIYHLDSGQVFANIAWVGTITMHTGININKISFSLNNLEQNAAVHETMSGTPYSLLAREAIEEGRSLTEVASILSGEDVHRTVAMIYILADGNNLTTKVLEPDKDYVTDYGPGDPEGIVTEGADLSIRTNFAFDTASFGAIISDDPENDAEERYDSLANNIQNNYGTIDLEKVIDNFLADFPVGNPLTLQSTVFRTDTLDFWVANATTDGSPAYSQTYYHYNDLSELINGGIDHHHSWYECAIATAAYGTPMASEVKTLSDFRDEYLLTNKSGRTLVSAYQRISPPIADFIRDKEPIKRVVRVGLKPIIWLAKKSLND